MTLAEGTSALPQPAATTLPVESPWVARNANPAVRVATAKEAAMPIDGLMHAMLDPDENVRARAQEMFDQALTTRVYQSAAGAPQPRR